MKLIDKDALVAEIERLREEYLKTLQNNFPAEWSCGTLDNILSFIDTLEVKEVDLEKEIEEHATGMPMSEFTHECEVEDFHEWAREEFRYFFELGLNASNPLTWEDVKLIWTIGDEIPYMPEEDFFKELLKRFKAQKGE